MLHQKTKGEGWPDYGHSNLVIDNSLYIVGVGYLGRPMDYSNNVGDIYASKGQCNYKMKLELLDLLAMWQKSHSCRY